MPFFYIPDREATLALLPNCREEGQEYEELNAGQYLRERLLAARYQHPAAKKQAQTVTAAA